MAINIKKCSIEEFMFQEVEQEISHPRRSYTAQVLLLPLAQTIINTWSPDDYASEGMRYAILTVYAFGVYCELYFGKDDTAVDMIRFLREIRPLLPSGLKASKPQEDKSTAQITFRYKQKFDNVDQLLAVRFSIATSGSCEVKYVTVERKVAEYSCSDAMGSFSDELTNGNALAISGKT